MPGPLEALLRPRSITALGASADFRKLNGRTLKALIGKHYGGVLCPVNPKYTDSTAGPRLAELDLNPAPCSAHRVAAVDWMMVLP